MSADTQAMLALELLLDHAFHDGDDRDLAVAAEAWVQAGYSLHALDSIAHSGTAEQCRDRVIGARYRRNRALLRADGRGMLAAVRALIDSGLLSEHDTMLARNQRWIGRGGHDRA